MATECPFHSVHPTENEGFNFMEELFATTIRLRMEAACRNGE